MKENSKQAILEATKELLGQVIQANDIKQEDVACAIFTTTPDLNAEFPAAAARELGWTQIALLCSHEIGVPGSLPRCLRLLLLVNTEKRNDELVHIYLRGAEVLRTDLSNPRRPL